MEEAIEEAVNTTVAIFVDKAVTRGMENAFDEAVEREVQERVHAIEDHFAAAVDKAVEEKVKVIQQKKIQRATQIAVLRTNVNAGQIAILERKEILTKFRAQNRDLEWLIMEKATKEWNKVISWMLELAELKKQDEEQL